MSQRPQNPEEIVVRDYGEDSLEHRLLRTIASSEILRDARIITLNMIIPGDATAKKAAEIVSSLFYLASPRVCFLEYVVAAVLDKDGPSERLEELTNESVHQYLDRRSSIGLETVSGCRINDETEVLSFFRPPPALGDGV